MIRKELTYIQLHRVQVAARTLFFNIDTEEQCTEETCATCERNTICNNLLEIIRECGKRMDKMRSEGFHETWEGEE